MGSYALSGAADADIETIAESSVRQWGFARTEAYVLGLHETFGRLAEFPELGRDAGHIRPGYRVMEAASHSVFYRRTDDGVLIMRVLHQHMDFERHL